MKLFLNISTILTIISSLYGFILFILNIKGSRTNLVFACYTFLVFLWSFFYFHFTNTSDPEKSLLYMQIAVGFAIFITPTFVHFTAHLIGQAHKYDKQITFFYIYALALYLTAYSPLFISSLQRIPPLTFFPLAGPTYIFLIIEYFGLFAYGLYLIAKERQNPSLPPAKKKELTWVFWGILLAYVGGGTNFPLEYGIPLYPIGNCFISFYMIFITYAILRYQSFDIRFIFKNSLIYTFLITFITIVYLALTVIIENQFRETFGYKSFFLSFVVAILVGLLFIPLKNILEKLIFKNSFVKILQENDAFRQEIINTEKLKSIATLASGMAHEIKNPLTALKTFSEYLPSKTKDEDFLNKFAPIIRHEVDRINALVNDLLDYAKPAPVSLKPMKLNTLLDHTLDVLSNTFIKNKIRLDKQYLFGSSPVLQLDGNQFKQALLNILLNAVDAMPSGGTLTVRTHYHEDKLRVTIQDSGVGIERGDLPLIFDPFFSKKDNGTGLGLSITHEIIKNHRGRIMVESTVGSGSAFIIELPQDT